MSSPHVESPLARDNPYFDESVWEDERNQAAITEFLEQKLRSMEAGLVVNLSFPGGVSPATPVQGHMLSERDLAERFQCTPRTVRRWESIGDLPPSVTYGGLKRWRAEDVEEWVVLRVQEAEQRHEAESTPAGVDVPGSAPRQEGDHE